MSQRPSRAKMNSWLESALRDIQILPGNPADIQALVSNAKLADRKIRYLAGIAAELGWHYEADLDLAWELIGEYEKEYQDA